MLELAVLRLIFLQRAGNPCRRRLPQLQEKLQGRFTVAVKLEVCSKAGVIGFNTHRAMCLSLCGFQNITNHAGKQENYNGNHVVIIKCLYSSIGWMLPHGQCCMALVWKPGYVGEAVYSRDRWAASGGGTGSTDLCKPCGLGLWAGMGGGFHTAVSQLGRSFLVTCCVDFSSSCNMHKMTAINFSYGELSSVSPNSAQVSHQFVRIYVHTFSLHFCLFTDSESCQFIDVDHNYKIFVCLQAVSGSKQVSTSSQTVQQQLTGNAVLLMYVGCKSSMNFSKAQMIQKSYSSVLCKPVLT